MRLFYSTASPYARKVRVVAFETGFADAIEVVATDVWNEAGDLRHHNPLGKVPTLTIDDGPALFDSRVICEYLDAHSTAAKVIPGDGPARWRALRLQALADGILDASVLLRQEATFRKTKERSQRWIDRQDLAVAKALDQLETDVGDFSAAPTIGELAVGCALGYRDFRFGDDDWRAGRPLLASWYASFRERPSMRETEPEG